MRLLFLVLPLFISSSVPAPCHVSGKYTTRYTALYFDLFSADVKPDEVSKLEKLFEIMKGNPNMEMEISAHADANKESSKAMQLSKRRARNVRKWLASYGIDKNRIKISWYGCNRTYNHCGLGVQCSEEEHRMNRRVEFKILKF